MDQITVKNSQKIKKLTTELKSGRKSTKIIENQIKLQKFIKIDEKSSKKLKFSTKVAKNQIKASINQTKPSEIK